MFRSKIKGEIEKEEENYTAPRGAFVIYTLPLAFLCDEIKRVRWAEEQHRAGNEKCARIRKIERPGQRWNYNINVDF